VHGFGASKGHWRHNLAPLSQAATVYAIDLLGFGNSSKPLSCLEGEPLLPGAVRYGFDLWAEQVRDFCLEVIGINQGIELQLIGNSIGGVVALNATRLLQAIHQDPQQVILIDCAQRELDLKRLDTQPWPARLARPLVMTVVRQRWIIQSLFQLLARPAFVRGVLQQAYPSGRNVDQELVDLLIRPSQQPGAMESFRGFVNLFNDWLAPQLLEQLRVPVRLLWGAQDPWEPLEEAQRWRHNHACIQELTVLDGLGHCPHDEAPEQVNPILLAWLQLGWR
jgi:pimeloyl-ACP methyl ester carboxylesterase